MVVLYHHTLGVIIITEKRFMQIRHWFSKHKITFGFIKLCYNVLPITVAISYILLLVTAFAYNDIFSEKFLKVLLVPAGVFVFVTLLRSFLNFPRPYETLRITPLIKKNTKGHSFPSRHTASVFIIAMTFLYIDTLLGVLFLIFSLLISLSRFLCGVHFIKDIVAGALISITSGIIFLFLI